MKLLITSPATVGIVQPGSVVIVDDLTGDAIQRAKVGKILEEPQLESLPLAHSSKKRYRLNSNDQISANEAEKV